MKNNIQHIIKAIIIIAIAYAGIIYYTRPEMEVTPETFKQTVRDAGYMVYESGSDTRPQNAVVSYLAMKGRMKINYATFQTNQEAKRFYTDFVNNTEEKHSQNISRDLRMGDKQSAEKQSYVYEYDCYLALYAKNAVVYTSGSSDYRPDYDEIFKRLFISPKIDFSKTLIGKIFPGLR